MLHLEPIEVPDTIQWKSSYLNLNEAINHFINTYPLPHDPDIIEKLEQVKERLWDHIFNSYGDE